MASSEFVENVIQTLKGLCLSNNNINTSIDGVNDNRITSIEDDNVETAEKLRAFHLLPTVALTLKPDETRAKLIPLLETLITSAVDNGDDEALMVVGEKLGTFVPLVGGGSYAGCLLPLLARIICCVEEIVVVQAACDSLICIIPTLDSSVIDTNCLQLIRNVFADDLYCASRKAGVRLIPVCYKQSNPESQNELKNRLLHLCMAEDEIPMVRAAAVEQLVDLNIASGSSLKNDMIKTLSSLVSDNQRVVRAACVKPLLELAKHVDAHEFESILMPLLDKLSEDSNRETRRGLAQVISEFQKVAQKFDKSLHTLLIKLMEDNEIDARKIVAGQLKEFCLVCPQQILSEVVLPKIREHLTVEREDRVKAELVKSVVMMIPNFKREDSLPLVQHVLSFLNDSNPQTKQYVFEHFHGLIGLISPGELQLTILPSLFKLFSDKNWRIRSGVVSSLSLFVPIVDEACCRDSLLSTALCWLRDPVWNIRQGTCDIIGNITARFPSLLSDKLAKAPILKELSEDPNYHFRQCWCFLVEAICKTKSTDANKELITSFLTANVSDILLVLIEKDAVPNVQISAVKSTHSMSKFFDKSFVNKLLLPLLKKLITSAADADVRYFSEIAVKSLECQ